MRNPRSGLPQNARRQRDRLTAGVFSEAENLPVDIWAAKAFLSLCNERGTLRTLNALNLQLLPLRRSKAVFAAYNSALLHVWTCRMGPGRRSTGVSIFWYHSMSPTRPWTMRRTHCSSEPDRAVRTQMPIRGADLLVRPKRSAGPHPNSR